MNLKKKTINGLFWSFIDNFTKQGSSFIIGIILARLLSPREFGLIGMTTVFIAISESFIDSGFGQALVRKKECTNTDYSTVFYFNLFVGILLYFVIYFSSSFISDFFKEPQLKLILKIISIGLLIKSFTLIHSIILIKRIDFKLQTKVSFISTIVGGIIGIVLAFYGFGVWSLVVKSLTAYSVASFLLWIWNKWRPSLEFSYSSFKTLFGFGSKLMVSGLLNKFYNNIFLLVVGRYFSATELGFYSRADQFKNLPTQNITAVVQRVSYPVLSSIQEDKEKLKAAYKRLIKSTMLIVFTLMFGLAAMAEQIVFVLVGDKWLPSVPYLQLLSFSGIFYPLLMINQNMLKVLGFSGTVLKLEIFKKILVIPIIFFGIKYGIIILILGIIVSSFISFLLDSHYSGRHIGYTTLMQVGDILPLFFISLSISGLVYILGIFSPLNMYLTLIIQLLSFVFLNIAIFELFKNKEYLYIKKNLLDKLRVNK